MSKEIIEKWKQAKISQGVFEFSCGGDSMGDTRLYFEDENGEEIEDKYGLESYFENEVYRNVSFYEASDGHYMGESGNVYITLNEEEDYFEYSKNAQSEWSEIKSGEVLVPITDEEFELIDTYVRGMAKSNWDGNNVDYKKDFILTDEIEKKLEALSEKFDGYAVTFEPETNGDIADDSHRYNTLNQETNTEIEYVFVDGQRHIKLFVQCECYEYSDSDD